MTKSKSLFKISTGTALQKILKIFIIIFKEVSSAEAKIIGQMFDEGNIA